MVQDRPQHFDIDSDIVIDRLPQVESKRHNIIISLSKKARSRQSKIHYRQKVREAETNTKKR